MELSRRSFFRGLGALFAAPPVAKIASLIPPLEAARVRSLDYLTFQMMTHERVKMFVNSNAFLENIDGQWADEFSKPGAKIGTQLRIRLPSNYRVS